MASSNAEILANAAQYERFLQERIAPDLAAAEAGAMALRAEAEQFQALHLHLQQLPPGPLNTLVCLGAHTYCAARVEDTSRVCVNIGLGFHCELTREEAGVAAGARREQLRRRLALREADVERLRAQAQLVRECLRELLTLPPVV